MGLQTHYCSCQKSIKKGPMNHTCLNIGGASHHLDSGEEFRLAFQSFLQPWVIDYSVDNYLDVRIIFNMLLLLMRTMMMTNKACTTFADPLADL